MNDGGDPSTYPQLSQSFNTHSPRTTMMQEMHAICVTSQPQNRKKNTPKVLVDTRRFLALCY